MSLPRVERAEELLDQPSHDPAELRQSLRHIDQVNRWLGGTRSLLGALEQVLPASGGRVLDLGTGSADLPRSIVRWARHKGLSLRVHATDIHPQMLEIARERSRGFPEIAVETADALRLPYGDATFTVGIMTLALHHFDRPNQLVVLRELARVSQRAVIIGELERCWPNYLGARFLAATWWRRNRLTRHDGPLSVLRAFTADELRHVGVAAGLSNVRVEQRFFYRLVMIGEPA